MFKLFGAVLFALAAYRARHNKFDPFGNRYM